MQRYRHRKGATQCQPLPDLEHPPRDMGVLHEGKFVALNRKFRQPVHHRENAVMMTRRNGFEKPGPCRLRRRQDEGGHARISGYLSEVQASDLACTAEEAEAYLGALGLAGGSVRRDSLISRFLAPSSVSRSS